MTITCNVSIHQDDMWYIAKDTDTHIVAHGRNADEAVEILKELLVEHYRKYGVPKKEVPLRTQQIEINI